jgi:TolA-binding protein
MKFLRAIAICLLASSALCLPGHIAHAQMDSREAIDLQNQIAELRQELQMMQQAQQSGNQAPPNYTQQTYAAPPPTQYGSQTSPSSGGNDTAADLLVRVSALEEQVRTLQGRVDDLTNQLQRQHDDLSKQIGDLSFKLGQGGPPPGGTIGAPGPVAPPPVPQPQPALPAHRTAEIALREGNSALARRDYAAAAAAAREVLETGHGPRLTDAQFLLARVEGAQGQFKDSAADYYKAYSSAPKSPTAQVALLGVANALLALNDKTDACQALAKLGAEFPQASPTVKQNASAARRRAGCGR